MATETKSNDTKPAPTEAAGAPNPIDAIKAGTENPKAKQSGKDGAAAFANGIASGVDLLKSGAKVVTDTVGEISDKGVTEKAKEAAKKAQDAGATFNKEFDFGSLLGGVAGGLLAWVFGSIFGGGTIGTIFSVLLAIPMAMIGSNQFGDTINGWLGRPKSKDKLAAETSPAPQQQRAAQPAVSQAPAAQPVATLSNEQLLAMMEAAKANGHRTDVVQARLKSAGGLEFQTVAPGQAAAGLISKANLDAKLAQCSAAGQASAIQFAPDGRGDYSYGCAPKATAPAETSRSRG
jgi:hypothetical protein